MTNFWATIFWVVYPLGKKISIFIDEKRRECSTPEEEEAHAQVEDCVQVLSSPDLASKSCVGDY